MIYRFRPDEILDKEENPFFIFVGQRGSGKTYMAAHFVYYLLSRRENHDATVIVLTGTKVNNFWQSQHYWYDGQKPLVYGTQFEHRMRALFKSQEKIADEGKKRSRVILLMDDILGVEEAYVEELKFLATSGRHVDIIGVVLTQHVSGITLGVRLQADATFAMPNLDFRTIETIWRECGQNADLTFNEFRRLYSNIANGRRCLVMRKSAEGTSLSNRINCYQAPPNAVVDPKKIKKEKRVQAAEEAIN